MKTAENKKQNLTLSILREKCPNCDKGDVFKNTPIFQLPVMHERCPDCNYYFDREPGYFLGAMYISYGLAVLEGIFTFFICQSLFPLLNTLAQILLVNFIIIACGRKNYKLSRIIYIHIFPW